MCTQSCESKTNWIKHAKNDINLEKFAQMRKCKNVQMTKEGLGLVSIVSSTLTQLSPCDKKNILCAI
jgi:hypothetical protein